MKGPWKRVFILSPANCNGKRARWLLKKDARSEIARRLRAGGGVPLGEVFTYLSALYFRGKLAYARAFAPAAANGRGVLVITSSAGLLAHDAAVGLAALRTFARVAIGKKSRRYRRALARSAAALAEEIGPDGEVILLGSIASGKYLDILTAVFGARLRVPGDFVGMGDMQRGALLLRCVREARELEYIAASDLVPGARADPRDEPGTRRRQAVDSESGAR